MKTFLHQLKIEFKLYFRSPGALLWSFIFPIVTISGLGVHFNGEKPIVIGIGVVDEDKSKSSTAFIQYLKSQAKQFTIEEGNTTDLAQKVRQNEKTGYILIPKGYEHNHKSLSFVHNPYQVQSVIMIRLLLDKVLAEFDLSQSGYGETSQYATIPLQVPEKKSYVHFLVPGVLSLQVMSYCLWGIGFVLLSYREKGNLKRISVTPVKKSSYIMAQLTHRYLIILLQVIFILSFAWLVFGVGISGNVFALGVALTLGMFAFMSLGFFIASIMPNLELCIGVNNILFLSMMALSGIFFSTDALPSYLQTVSRFLPLTHLSTMVRGIYVEGASLTQFGTQIIGLGLYFVLTFVGSLYFFRWQK